MDLDKVLEKISGKTFASKVQSSGKQVFGKGYTIGDDMTLANLASLDDKQFLYANLLKLIVEKYSLEPKDYEHLTLRDIQWLAKDLRIHSDGEELELMVNCGTCKTKSKIVVDLKQVAMSEGETERDIKIDSTCTLRVEAPTYDVTISHQGALEELGEALKKTKKLDADAVEKAVMKNKELFIRSIKTITVGAETTRGRDLDKDQLERFVLGLPRKTIKEFVKFYEQLPSIELSQEIVCHNKDCAKKLKLDFDDFFLSLL